jgi:hypothetical protein
MRLVGLGDVGGFGTGCIVAFLLVIHRGQSQGSSRLRRIGNKVLLRDKGGRQQQATKQRAYTVEFVSTESFCHFNFTSVYQKSIFVWNPKATAFVGTSSGIKAVLLWKIVSFYCAR